MTSYVPDYWSNGRERLAKDAAEYILVKDCAFPFRNDHALPEKIFFDKGGSACGKNSYRIKSR